MFGQQITEYTCNTTGLDLQWIVEPVAGRSENVIRFTINGRSGSTLTEGNIVGMQDARDPIVSRLRITSDPSLLTADVVCLSSDGINVTRPYFIDMFSKLYLEHT